MEGRIFFEWRSLSPVIDKKTTVGEGLEIHWKLNKQAPGMCGDGVQEEGRSSSWPKGGTAVCEWGQVGR